MPTLDITGTANQSPRLSAQQNEGKYEMNRETLQQFGGVNGSITDVLSTVPNVQFSDDSANALTELKPQSVSISGGRYYDNNFSINGVSNNNLLDPASSGSSDSSINDVPGHEQSFFFDLDQIESITVYDSNVPAEYGRFTGGVVDAKIRQPSMDQKTKVSYFTTQANWVDYKIITNVDQSENAVTTSLSTPQFSRSRYIVSHEGAINDEHSLRLGVTYQDVSSPQLSLLETKSVTEQSASFTLTHGMELDSGTKATTFISYAPYAKNTLLTNVQDSDYTLTGGGIMLSSNIETYINNQKHYFTIAYSQSEQSREAPNHMYNWLNSRSKNWGLNAGLATSSEGGYGDLDKEQSNLSLSWKSKSKLNSALTLVYGSQLLHSQAGFDRPQDSYIYQRPVSNTGVQCAGQFSDCAQREQYFSERTIYVADNVDVALLELALFGEMELDFNRWNVTLGARVDHDDFLNNTNIAWRSRALFDISGDKNWMLNIGANRYYSGPLLTYKLRQAAKPYITEYRGLSQNVVNPWEDDGATGTYKYRFTDTKTPYSDELVAGLRTNLLNGVGEIKVLQRKNRDEFSRTTTETQQDGYRYYLVNNDGYSNYHSIALNWDGKFKSMTFGMNITWSKTESSNDTYDDGIDAATSDRAVWYNGQRKRLSDISQLRQDFSRPLIASAYIYAPIAYGVNGMLKARFQGSYNTIIEGSDTYFTGIIVDANGNNVAEKLSIYEDHRKQATVLLDGRLEWQPTFLKSLLLSAEINNVLNSRTYSVADDDDGIETGRSFWLGAELTF